MAQRLMAAVLKTAVVERLPWVRIPLPPPFGGLPRREWAPGIRSALALLGANPRRPPPSRPPPNTEGVGVQAFGALSRSGGSRGPQRRDIARSRSALRDPERFAERHRRSRGSAQGASNGTPSPLRGSAGAMRLMLAAIVILVGGSAVDAVAHRGLLEPLYSILRQALASARRDEHDPHRRGDTHPGPGVRRDLRRIDPAKVLGVRRLVRQLVGSGSGHSLRPWHLHSFTDSRRGSRGAGSPLDC